MGPTALAPAWSVGLFANTRWVPSQEWPQLTAHVPLVVQRAAGLPSALDTPPAWPSPFSAQTARLSRGSHDKPNHSLDGFNSRLAPSHSSEGWTTIKRRAGSASGKRSPAGSLPAASAVCELSVSLLMGPLTLLGQGPFLLT